MGAAEHEPADPGLDPGKKTCWCWLLMGMGALVARHGLCGFEPRPPQPTGLVATGLWQREEGGRKKKKARQG